MYPTLIHVRYNLLLSNPNAPEQDFHFDYVDHTTEKNPEQQPVSLIVGIDPFLLLTVEEPPEDMNITTSTGLTYRIQPGGCINFTNKVQHAGGKNIFQIDGKPAHAVRIFAYMVSHERDFPGDTVTYFPDSNAGNELQGDEEEEDDANDSDDESESGFTNRRHNTSNDADDKSQSGFRNTGDISDTHHKHKPGFRNKSDMRDDATSDEDTFHDDNLQYCQKPVWEDDEERMNDTKKRRHHILASDDESNSGEESPVPIPAMDPPLPAMHHPQRVSVYSEAIHIVRNFTSTHNSPPPPPLHIPEQMQEVIQ